jgi:LacI family transcriptional regulator
MTQFWGSIAFLNLFFYETGFTTVKKIPYFATLPHHYYCHQMSKPTIRSIAKDLGLSIGTVSKALKDNHEISEETKQRVFAIVKAQNYVPNPYASSLRKQTSKTIAVVLPEVTDSFFSLAINGIESIARERGYHVLIYLTHEDFERESGILKQFTSGRVDGILLSVSSQTTQSEHISDAIQEGLPVVFFDRTFEDINTCSVITNDYECGYLATKHLIEKGCKKISYLNIAPKLLICRSRMDGFKQALIDAGIKIQDNSIVSCSHETLQNEKIIHQLLQSKKRPDGLIAPVEKLIPPIYRASQTLNLNIPNQLKVVCFTNLASVEFLNPSLTTITQPAFEMGKTAAINLFRKIEKKREEPKETIVIPSVLIERNSTKNQ